MTDHIMCNAVDYVKEAEHFEHQRQPSDISMRMG